MDINDHSPLDDFYVTSISKNEALAKLLGWRISCTHSNGSSSNLSDEEQEAADTWSFSVLEILESERTPFENALFEAKHAEFPDANIIAEQCKALAEFDKKIDQAKRYLCAIDDELSKGDDASALRLDKNRQGNAGPYITAHSFNEWANEKYAFGKLPKKSPLPSSTQESSNKPWNTHVTGDPKPEQPWYTPARYFARQLVIDDSTLLAKKGLLAQKVAQSLTNAGIANRGRKKPFDPGTVLKAFSNVILG